MRQLVLSQHERRLCQALGELPRKHAYTYQQDAQNELIKLLFRSMIGDNPKYSRLLFPAGSPSSEPWSLKTEQGAVEGAEYTAGARGKACGHIFKCGETSYRCRTCSLDETCVLCNRCFDASEHAGHAVSLSVSPGNSGCCDCGDQEAWRIPVACAIHSDLIYSDSSSSQSSPPELVPDEVKDSIRMTIARVLDYMCDVISCSPEHLRETKSEKGVRDDEAVSRLHEHIYGTSEQTEPPEYSMILWNDEKHTIAEVEEQVKKACKVPHKFASARARETSDVGRAVIEKSADLKTLLSRATVIEQIKITVTVRSSRDTFREQMCGTMIDWLADISGCSVGEDFELIRTAICEEMLGTWRQGSSANNAMVGKNGIDDLEKTEPNELRRYQLHLFPTAQENQADQDDDNSEGPDGAEDEEFEDLENMEVDDTDERDIRRLLNRSLDSDTEMSGADDDDALEMAEATLAGYPRPPPPPLTQERPAELRRAPDGAASDSDGGGPVTQHLMRTEAPIPETPRNDVPAARSKPAAHWLEKPKGSLASKGPISEDIRRRVRLDFLLLFDLRLWKRARIGLRDLYISTVVTIPQFKRLLGLRLAAFYPTLAQLYLIADREPDHSIINLSLQILTTPSITNEVVERSNFLTNLISILYTFLTRRQVGHPYDVDANATLAFETGSLTNRRMYHFFMDLRHILNSVHVQEKIRTESRYTLQFLDLVKLHQGICPNVRAVGEHVEYENDAWISASLITREINKLCRQFSEPFQWRVGDNPQAISSAIRLVATTAMLNSLGLERDRFQQAEIKNPTTFKALRPLEFDTESWDKNKLYQVVDFDILKQPISFHHALHYTLSWFIDGAKSMPCKDVRNLLAFKNLEFRPDRLSTKTILADLTEEQLLLALYDFPLRVCAWLAQMKAGIWVRNGLSLRHQSSTYRGVGQRDVAHQRDIFLLQSALVICNPSVILMSMIDRFGMYEWCQGSYSIPPVFEDKQMIEVAEDFIHLLIILLTDRISLLPTEDAAVAQKLAIKRDITHVLCFKPLSYSELTGRLADRYQELDDFTDLLTEMTTYRSPEGLSDYGTFELKEQYLANLDPYIAHYNKNQRDESETAYRNLMAKQTGKVASEVVYEPTLLPIPSGLFKDLASFTSTNIFAQIIFSFLTYALDCKEVTTSIESGRVEAFLHVVLHLTLIAVLEDKAEEDEMSEESLQSFAHLALTKASKSAPPERNTIANILQRLLERDELQSCFTKINLILRRLKNKRPRTFYQIISTQAHPVDRMDTESPASGIIDEKELKRKRAHESRAKVMAHFQKEQQNFMNQQSGIDWGVEDFSDSEEGDKMTTQEDVRKTWKYPSGTCIFCQDAVNESRIFGTFGMIIDSNILRQTDLRDPDFMMECVQTPENLDQSAEKIRPFGVSGQNIEIVEKMAYGGTVNVTQRQGLGKGFPYSHIRRGPVSTGCGHLMHYDCFDVYYAATARRQSHQVARAHPERLSMKEFVCPLCKAIGNAFLPIIWKSKSEEPVGLLQSTEPFDLWLGTSIGPAVSRMGKVAEVSESEKQAVTKTQEILGTFASKTFVNTLNKRLERYSERPPTQPPSMLPQSQFPQSQLPARPELPLTNFITDSEFVELHELNGIYKRLRDTIRCNSLNSNYTYTAHSQHLYEDLTFSDTLARTFGYSISAVEIAHRGTQSDRGATWLQNVPDSSLTHLRIFSETVFSYIAVGGLRNSANNMNKNIAEFWDMQRRQLHQLFIGHNQIFGALQMPESVLGRDPLFQEDLFIFLTECTMFLIPALNLDFHHIMHLCYIAEIVKVVSALLRERKVLETCSAQWIKEKSSVKMIEPDERNAMTKMVLNIAFQMSDTEIRWTDESFESAIPVLYRLIRSYALPFLRKCILLLHTKYSVDFSSPDISSINDAEVERLANLLRLPSLLEIFTDLAGPGGSPNNEGTLVSELMNGWLRHWVLSQESAISHPRRQPAILLSHPAIFELVGLPGTFDILIEQVMRRHCPTTGKDMTDPCVCLFCGEIFCSQAFCCIENGKLGGCNQHVRKCGGQVGIFINIRKCCVLYLHQQNGSWSVAPYLDCHGETDPGLRRHHQLYLHQRRYDALLRAAWLNHSIPSTISRKLEADLNNGGWETL